MSDDDWMTAAMENTDLVAELLVKLRAAVLATATPTRPAPLQSWTIHPRRSRTQPAALPVSNKSEPPRASPSTPLSWSGATSTSGRAGAGAAIVDPVDSAQPNHNRSDFSRSKVTTIGATTPSKRPRKKKTVAALKEEAMLLKEEQNDLKRKVATLHAKCENMRKDNERLKSMKIQLDRQQDFEGGKDKFVVPDLNDPAWEDA